MTLDGFAHTSLISRLVANRTKFFLSLILEVLNLGLWRSLSFGGSLSHYSLHDGWFACR